MGVRTTSIILYLGSVWVSDNTFIYMQVRHVSMIQRGRQYDLPFVLNIFWYINDDRNVVTVDVLLTMFCRYCAVGGVVVVVLLVRREM